MFKKRRKLLTYKVKINENRAKNIPVQTPDLINVVHNELLLPP